MSRPETFQIDAEGKASQSGVNYGPGDDILTVHHEDAKTIVFKWKGHTGWSGRGSQSYYPTTFLVYRKVEEVEPHPTKIGSNGIRSLKLERVCSFPVKAGAK